MTWITTIPFAQATGKLRKLYERVTGPHENVDNIMLAHSLRPHSMEGHMALYKYVLHHSGNALPKWFLETIGVWVSLLNECDYCVEHHFAGLRRLLSDDERADRIYVGLKARDIDGIELPDSYSQALVYARQLTLDPSGVTEDMLVALRAEGLSDGEILEINQVTAYFAYANRTVLGLGVSTEGDVLGLSPGNSADADDWSHR
ncbi:MAG: peroxidase-related enzyme [Pseudomonadota bacterium]